MISEKKKEEIRRNARKVLDGFSVALEKVNLEAVKQRNIKKLKKSVGGFREESQRFKKGSRSPKGDGEFRKRMFENAPKKYRDCIVAEKKKW